MNKKDFTYRIWTIFIGIVAWEVIFWTILIGLFSILGYFNSGVGEQLNFKNSNVLWLNLLLIPITFLYIYSIQRTNNLYSAVGEKVRKHIFRRISSFRSFTSFFLFRNALVFLIIAMAQPIFGSKKITGTVESLELVLCLDISNSMNVKDIDAETSRLEIAKRAIAQLVNNLHGEKLGICVFANSAFTQLPITMDYSAAKMYVKDIETNMISSQGTNIRAALENSVSMFSEDKESTKGIIMITDGENHEEDPKDVLKEIKEKKIQLIVLGLGTKGGGLVPKNPARPELGYKTTPSGTTVLSKLNPKFINDIAMKGGGFATFSSDPFPDLTELLKQVNRMKKSKIASMEFDVKENRYQVPLFISILFFALYLVLSTSILTKVENIVIKK